MGALRKRAAILALAAVTVAGVHGCTEQLEGGRACPILCPGQTVELRDTLVAAVMLDTTLAGYPAIGDEPALVLASRGDTLETRVIVRYDTLPTAFRPPNSPTDTPIELVEDAQLEVRLAFPTLFPDRAVTIDAYDVDTTLAEGGAADTAAATMLPLFRADRFLGSVTFTPSEVQAVDSTVRVPIDNAHLLAKIQAQARLRVGLLVRGDESAELVLLATTSARPPQISFRVSSDEAVPRVVARPHSATPTDGFIAAALADFVIVAQRREPDTPREILAVGGVPGRRSYLRFDLPRGIIDSTSVVRATLLLTQYPNRLAPNGADSVSLYPQPVVASELVTDLRKAVTLVAGGGIFRIDSLRTAPDDSGTVAIEVGGLVQVWRITEAGRSSRALVLSMPTEGVGLDELYFFSSEAAADLRPRLRIVYAPRVGFGLP